MHGFALCFEVWRPTWLVNTASYAVSWERWKRWSPTSPPRWILNLKQCLSFHYFEILCRWFPWIQKALRQVFAAATKLLNHWCSFPRVSHYFLILFVFKLFVFVSDFGCFSLVILGVIWFVAKTLGIFGTKHWAKAQKIVRRKHPHVVPSNNRPKTARDFFLNFKKSTGLFPEKHPDF